MRTNQKYSYYQIFKDMCHLVQVRLRNIIFKKKHIQTLQSGQYNPKFYNLIRENNQEVKYFCLNLEQFIYQNEKCYILNGIQLQSIRLIIWDELLYEQSDNNEWEKCFKMPIDIHTGQLILL
ncbi:unnamed protein product [Paramecium pentaurelia]|uniref:Uncharacterized protein n=1 Tax=Paramecium pentaurelia TaxID=43138 RepID=A0A8S1Y1V9_9CILI|nr:unnamed protein product [Paramecium pentaurelia]